MTTTYTISEPVKPYRITLHCNEEIDEKPCNGNMVSTGIAYMTHPQKYEYQCTKCNAKVARTEIFPRIDYR